METVAIKSEVQAAKMQPNQSMVMGRIDHSGTFEYKGKRVHETRVAIAAPDAYSMPGMVVVQSTYKLGSKGDDCKILVSVTGIPNDWKDRTTGEVKLGANVRLVAVE